MTLVGKLERDGSLTFPEHKFARSQSAAFEEWLRELRTYGAQGTPSGKALWGLSREQFEGMTNALATPVEEEVAGLPFDEAIRTLHLAEQYPFRLSIAAQQTLAAPGVKKQPGRVLGARDRARIGFSVGVVAIRTWFSTEPHTVRQAGACRFAR